MSCGCSGCVPRSSICVPRGDYKRLLFSVRDSEGDEVDLTGVSDIAFVVSQGQSIGGNIYPGGTVLFEKRLSDGEITVAGNLYQFLVDVTRTDSMIPIMRNNYFEARIYRAADAEAVTVAAGRYLAEFTQLENN